MRTRTAVLLMGAATAEERARAVATGSMTSAAILSGVDGVISSCR